MLVIFHVVAWHNLVTCSGEALQLVFLASSWEGIVACLQVTELLARYLYLVYHWRNDCCFSQIFLPVKLIWGMTRVYWLLVVAIKVMCITLFDQTFVHITYALLCGVSTLLPLFWLSSQCFRQEVVVDSLASNRTFETLEYASSCVKCQALGIPCLAPGIPRLWLSNSGSLGLVLQLPFLWYRFGVVSTLGIAIFGVVLTSFSVHDLLLYITLTTCCSILDDYFRRWERNWVNVWVGFG